MGTVHTRYGYCQVISGIEIVANRVLASPLNGGKGLAPPREAEFFPVEIAAGATTGSGRNGLLRSVGHHLGRRLVTKLAFELVRSVGLRRNRPKDGRKPARADQ